jgi:copper chaperone CopZ
MAKYEFKIADLNCDACVKMSVQALLEINGVTKASVDLKSGIAVVESDRKLPWDEIVKALASADKHAEKLP